MAVIFTGPTTTIAERRRIFPRNAAEALRPPVHRLSGWRAGCDIRGRRTRECRGICDMVMTNVADSATSPLGLSRIPRHDYDKCCGFRDSSGRTNPPGLRTNPGIRRTNLPIRRSNPKKCERTRRATNEPEGRRRAPTRLSPPLRARRRARIADLPIEPERRLDRNVELGYKS